MSSVPLPLWGWKNESNLRYPRTGMGRVWCPIVGKWNWTNNVSAAKTFSSNDEAAAEFRRVGLDPVGYMVQSLASALITLAILLRKIAQSALTRCLIQT